MKPIAILLVFSFLTFSCKNNEKEIQLINEIKTIAKANEVEIKEEETILITVHTRIEETELENTLLTSLIYKAFIENYNPSIVDNNKLVKIELIDGNNEFTRTEKIKSIYKLEDAFKKGLKLLNVIFKKLESPKEDKVAIEKYRNSKEFNAIENNLERVNINGITQINITNPDNSFGPGYEIYATTTQKGRNQVILVLDQHLNLINVKHNYR